MESIYDLDIYNPIKNDLKIYQCSFVLAPELWKKYSIDDLPDIDFKKWKRIKLMRDGNFSKELSQIPTEYGGIYIYCIEPNIVPDIGIYVMYIGKATKTPNQNLRKRVQSYKRDLVDDETRPRIHRLLNLWGDSVYVYYLPINSNKEVITALEDRLIAAYGKPPCNAEVRCKSVRLAVRAFE